MKLKSTFLLAALAVAGVPSVASACGGNEPMLGQICTVGFNFCPRGYAEAAGQLLPIAQNQALFSLYGTTYGGDGRTTFALPDLRGRTMVGMGQGPGLADIRQGELGGAATVTLTTAQMPPHTHAATTAVTATGTLNAVSGRGNATAPGGAAPAASSTRDSLYSTSTPNTTMAPGALTVNASATTTVGNAGGGQAVSVRSPYLGVKHCVALVGIYPSRN